MIPKVTRPVVQRQAGDVAVEAARALLHPLLPMKDNPIIVASPSCLTQQDYAPPRIGQGAFQILSFFRPTQQIFHGEPSHGPSSQPVILGHEILSSLPLVQSKLGVHEAIDFLNITALSTNITHNLWSIKYSWLKRTFNMLHHGTLLYEMHPLRLIRPSHQSRLLLE